MKINILEVIVAAVILLFAAVGYRKGFVKKLAAMVSLLISVALVSALLPWITGFLKEYHSLDSDDIGILSLMLRNARIGYKACMCRQMGLSEKEISGRLNVNAAAFAFSKELSVQKIYMMMDILQQSVNSIKEGKNAELITVTTASRLINLI